MYEDRDLLVLTRALVSSVLLVAMAIGGGVGCRPRSSEPGGCTVEGSRRLLSEVPPQGRPSIMLEYDGEFEDFAAALSDDECGLAGGLVDVEITLELAEPFNWFAVLGWIVPNQPLPAGDYYLACRDLTEGQTWYTVVDDPSFLTIGTLSLSWVDVRWNEKYDIGACRTGWHLRADGLPRAFWDQGGIVTIEHPPDMDRGTGWTIGDGTPGVGLDNWMDWDEDLRNEYVVTAVDAYGNRFPIPGGIPERPR